MNRITPLKAISIFSTATGYFFLLLFTLLPFLKHVISMNPALYWFMTGYFLFIPLFVYATMMARAEGNRGAKQTFLALDIRPFSKRDWLYSIIGLLLVFALSGMVFAGSILLNKYFGMTPLTMTPWFMEMQPFQGTEKLFLLVWLPMFFFNIVGEELLWRGYIQKRLTGKYSWTLCSFLWLFFHLPFGIDLMIVLVPIVVTVPYIFHKTHNTLVGVFIHGMYNGPLFVAVALGFIR